MTKFAVITHPSYGHVQYTLPLIQELVAREQEVVYYLTDDFRESIEATGARFLAYQVHPRSLMPLAGGQMMQALESLTVEQPDVLIYDYMTTWASLLARKLAIPAVSIHATFAINKHYTWKDMDQYTSPTWPHNLPHLAPVSIADEMCRNMEQMCRKIDLPISEVPSSVRELYTPDEPLNICFIPREFQPMVETFENYLYVGPSISPHPHPRGTAPLTGDST